MRRSSPLNVVPQAAFSNIARLRARYPGVYGPGGFFDAVNPTTGSVGTATWCSTNL